MGGTIHIFDMDDTLLVTPTFAEIWKNGESAKVQEFLDNIRKIFLLFMSKDIRFETSKSGQFIVLIDAAKGSPLHSSYLNTFEEKLLASHAEIPNPETFSKQVGVKRSSVQDALKCLEAKEGHIVISEIRGFHADPNTIGNTGNSHVISDYVSAQNKMILTGRNIKLGNVIKDRLEEMGLPFPNYGLFCYIDNGKGIKSFKSDVILDSIEQNNWQEVHFYEDKKEWLDSAEEAVLNAYPDVRFVKHYIDNVRKGRVV